MHADGRLRLLFLCTGNSARSQIAEALLQNRRDARIEAASAGTAPAAQVNPFAIAELERRSIDWSHAQPKSLNEVIDQDWDMVITVCDSARESCPIIPGQPATAHWGIPDPAAVQGDDATKTRAFQETARVLARRVDLLLALPLDKLESLALENRLREIGCEP